MIFYASSFEKVTAPAGKGRSAETGALRGVTLCPVGEHEETKAAMGEHPMGRIEIAYVPSGTPLAKAILANQRVRVAVTPVQDKP